MIKQVNKSRLTPSVTPREVESMFYEEEELYSISDNGISGAFCGTPKDRMSVLSRYESSIERALMKALHELQRLQSARLFK